jgi:hypothetical protein
VERVRRWVLANLEGADVEQKTYHGQMRFTVPVGVFGMAGGGGSGDKKVPAAVGQDEIHAAAAAAGGSGSSSGSAIGKLVVLLEENREALGIEHYSVSPTTLDQVFLTVVGAHNVKEEGYQEETKKKAWWRFGK